MRQVYCPICDLLALAEDGDRWRETHHCVPADTGQQSRPISHVDGNCPGCGHPTLVANHRDALGGLPFPSLPEGVASCANEDCMNHQKLVTPSGT